MAEVPVVEEVAAEEPAPPPEPARRYGALIGQSRGQDVLFVEPDAWHETCLTMLTDGWSMLVDLTAVDYLTYSSQRNLPDGMKPERFEVVASFVRFDTNERVRLRAQVSDEAPSIASLYALYPGSDYLEREVYDMFGIVFEGHPDLSRILMPEHWEGHPLRKDFAVGEIPVQFKHTAGLGPQS